MLKKRIYALALVLMLIIGQTAFADVAMKLDGKALALKYKVNPMRIGNTMMLPLRDTFEALGATVTFDTATQTAIITKNTLSARFKIGESSFFVNGKKLMMDQKSQIKSGRFFVPAHVVEQVFGVAMVATKDQLAMTTNKKEKFRIATLNGPTGVAMAQLITNNYLGENADLSYEVLANPQLLPAKLIKGEIDMAFMPTNMASIVYNQSKGQVAIVSTNIWGLLSVITTDPQIKSWSDLKGKQIDIFGQGATPEVAFKALAEANGLNPKSDLSYKFAYDTASTLATALASGQVKDGVAVLPEPAASIALAKNKNARVLYAFDDAWKAAFNGQGMPMNVVVVRREFLDKNQDLVRSFLREFKTDIANMNANPKAIAKLVDQLPQLNFAAAIVEDAIPRSGYRFETASASKIAIQKYLKVLLDFEPKTIGGKVPGDDFYIDVFTDY